MRKYHWQILRTLGAITAAACWITLGAMLSHQTFWAGANILQVCGSVG